MEHACRYTSFAPVLLRPDLIISGLLQELFDVDFWFPEIGFCPCGSEVVVELLPSESRIEPLIESRVFGISHLAEPLALAIARLPYALPQIDVSHAQSVKLRAHLS